MAYRLFGPQLLPSTLFVCACLPGAARAGDSYYGRYGPPPPPNWGYYGLPAGPYLTTDYPFAGWPGYRGAYGRFVRHAPPVPVYGPLPDVFTNPDPIPHPQRRRLGFGLGYYGWVGPYRASPRPAPLTVSVWPVAPAASGAGAGDCLCVAVKVPASAEVLVDGVKTAQTGADRRFESPPLEAGTAASYELTARWVEDGATVERTKVVSGKPGETVAVDFTAADVVRTGR